MSTIIMGRVFGLAASHQLMKIVQTIPPLRNTHGVHAVARIPCYHHGHSPSVNRMYLHIHDPRNEYTLGSSCAIMCLDPLGRLPVSAMRIRRYLLHLSLHLLHARDSLPAHASHIPHHAPLLPHIHVIHIVPFTAVPLLLKVVCDCADHT